MLHCCIMVGSSPCCSGTLDLLLMYWVDYQWLLGAQPHFRGVELCRHTVPRCNPFFREINRQKAERIGILSSPLQDSNAEHLTPHFITNYHPSLPSGPSLYKLTPLFMPPRYPNFARLMRGSNPTRTSALAKATLQVFNSKKFFPVVVCVAAITVANIITRTMYPENLCHLYIALALSTPP